MHCTSISRTVTTLFIISVCLIQILSISDPLLTNDQKLRDSFKQGKSIPKLADNSDSNYNTEVFNQKTISYNGPPTQESNTEIDTLSITSNTEFSTIAIAQGWEGSGNQYDPYIIRNMNFTSGESVTRLKIQDTTSHFIIQNCVFVDADNLTVLLNVKNGVIKENLFLGAVDYGLFIDTTCQYIRVIHNAFLNTPSGGINVYNNNSIDNLFQYNYFDNHLPLNQPQGGVFWTDPYLLNGAGADPTPRVHIEHFNVLEVLFSSNPQLDSKAYELGWLGGGTVNNPYIIANYNFSFAGETPLLGIMGTSKYLTIKNCYFNSKSLLPGIFIDSCSNIQIVNSSFEYCQTGLTLSLSNSINVTGIEVRNSLTEGINFDTCYDLRIYDCKINNTGTNGLYSNNVDNSSISNILIYNTSHNGIYLRNAYNITVINSHMENITFRGLFVQDSQWIGINECLIQKNYAINSGGIRTDRASHITINNTQIHDISQYAIYFYSTSNSSVDFTNVSHNFIGLNTYRVDDCNITRSRFSNSSYIGVSIDPACSNNLFSLSDVFNCSTGIQLVQADDNYIINNFIYENNRGIYLWGQEGAIRNNKINNNVIKNNREDGIFDQYGMGNIYFGNTIEGNGYEHNQVGINISSSSANNIIAGNHFLSNSAWDSGSNNSWDNGTHGNYWDDYFGTDDIAPFGIGDIPYEISGPANSTDRFPLMLTSVLAIIELLSPANGSVIKSSTPLNLLIEGSIDFTYNWNGGSNDTQPLGIQINFPEEDGFHVLTVYVSYRNGSWLVKSFAFTIDNTPPNMLSWDGITNGSEVGTGTTIPFSVTDINFENFWYFWNNSGQTIPIVYADIPWVVVPLVIGTWSLNIFANDTAGNVKEETIIVEILTAVPLELLYPIGGEIDGGYVNVSWFSPESITCNLFYSPDSGLNWIQLADSLDESFYNWGTSSSLLNGSTFLVRVVSTTEGKPGEVRSSSTFTLLNIIKKLLPVGTTEIQLPDVEISITVSEETNVTIKRVTNVSSIMDPTEEGFIDFGLFIELTLDNPDALIILIIRFSVADIWDMIEAQGLTLYDVNIYFYNETSNQWEPADSTSRDLVYKIVIGTFNHTTTIGALGRTKEDPSPNNLGAFIGLLVLVVFVLGTVGTGAFLVYDHQQKTQLGGISLYSKLQGLIKSSYSNIQGRFNKKG